MSTSIFPIKRGDLVPAITATLLQNGGAIDLTAATSIRFVMRTLSAGLLKVDAAATVVSAVAGTVKYQWVGTDTDTPGIYSIEWRITWAGGDQTIPSAGYDYVRVSGTSGVVYAPPEGSGLVFDGDLATLANGVTAGISRANLAADPAFTSRYALVVNPANVGTTRADGPVFLFGGVRKVAIAVQGSAGQAPGAGVVEVDDGATNRKINLTHYQYGATLQSTGTNGGILELWLGDISNDAAPNLSVRHNGSGEGAIVQARDSGDVSGVQLDFRVTARPKIAVELNAALPSGTVFAIENANLAGTIAFATKVGAGALTDRVTILNSGYVGIGPSVPNQVLGVSSAGGGIAIQDTQASGKSFELLSGSVGAGIFTIYDRTANSHRLSILSDGSVKVAGMLNSQYLTDLTNTIAYLQTDYDATHAFALNNRTASKIPWSVRGAAAQTADLVEHYSGAAIVGGVTKDGRFRFVAGNEQTTIGAAGGASALPATPTKYLKIIDSAGTTLIIPAYAAA